MPAGCLIMQFVSCLSCAIKFISGEGEGGDWGCSVFIYIDTANYDSWDGQNGSENRMLYTPKIEEEGDSMGQGTSCGGVVTVMFTAQANALNYPWIDLE